MFWNAYQIAMLLCYLDYTIEEYSIFLCNVLAPVTQYKNDNAIDNFLFFISSSFLKISYLIMKCTFSVAKKFNPKQ